MLEKTFIIWYLIAPYVPRCIAAPIDRLCRAYIRRLPFFTEADILWFEEHEVPGVRDQGNAGTCYAFALCDVITAALAIASKVFVVLAPQWFINVMPRNRRYTKEKIGIKGVLNMEDALRFARDVGVGEEDEFPYTARPQRSGHGRNAKMRIVRIGSYVANDNKSDIFELIKNGPVVASIYVDDRFREHEGTEVYFPPKTSKKTVAKVRAPMDLHAVAVIGVGTTREGVPFCLIKNSWKRTWGYHGCARVHPSALCRFSYPIDPYLV